MARFTSEFLEDIRDRVPCSSLIGQTVKLRRAGREWQGLCPFHKEKTPSFYVNDAKGFGHCFGCGWNGDQFAFVMERDGCDFPGAVERLAGMAGVQMPASDPEVQRAEQRQASIIRVLEDAHRQYTEGLLPEHRAYLSDRGITAQQIQTYGIGYAPPGGIRIQGNGVAAGLVNDEGRQRLRNRIVFPIRDRRGRVVAFGGRILGDGKPKYLNTSETEVFKKGATLYNASNAMEVAHSGAEVVASEGYFDAIALASAGFASVGTMGTALTADHLRALWRMADVPIVCFDGDSAGARAALKAIETAFPVMVPGRTLRFAVMPTGLDPSDMLRDRGAESLRRAVTGAASLPDTMWRLVTRGRSLTSPDALAAIEAEIMKMIKTISDGGLKRRYAQDVRDRVHRLPREHRTGIVRSNGNTHHSASPGAFRLMHGIDGGGLSMKEAVLVREARAQPLQVDIEAVASDASLSARVLDAISDIVTAADDGHTLGGAAVRVVDEAESLLRSVGV